MGRAIRGERWTDLKRNLCLFFMVSEQNGNRRVMSEQSKITGGRFGNPGKENRLGRRQKRGALGMVYHRQRKRRGIEDRRLEMRSDYEWRVADSFNERTRLRKNLKTQLKTERTNKSKIATDRVESRLVLYLIHLAR